MFQPVHRVYECVRQSCEKQQMHVTGLRPCVHDGVLEPQRSHILRSFEQLGRNTTKHHYDRQFTRSEPLVN